MPTPSMEDYLEKIYQLIEEKGYARSTDIADALVVNPSSVTKMLQKLAKDDYVIYEKYRGIILTSKGTKIGKRLVDRHQILEEFLRIIGIEDEDSIYKEVEGIEHHLKPESIAAIEVLVNFFRENDQILRQLKDFRYDSEMKE